MSMEMEQKKKEHNFLIQGIILAAAGIVTRLIGLIYRIPVNNILGDEGQGFYGCAFSIYNIALLLTSYSLPLAVSKLVSARVSRKEYKNAMRIFKSALAFAFVVGALVAVIVYFASDFIAGNLMSLQFSAYALRVLAPCLFVVAIMGVLRGFFQGLGTMIPTALSQIAEQIVNAIVSIVGASYLLEMGKKVAESKSNPSLPAAYGAAGGTLGTLMGAVTGLLFLLVVMKAYFSTWKRKLHKDHSRYTESYGDIYKVLLLTIAPVILSTAIYNISETIDQGIFSNIIVTQGYTEKKAAEFLGMYSGKYQTMVNIPLAVANALGASLIPSLTATVASGTRAQVHSKIRMVIRFSMMIAIPSAIGFIVMGEPILDLLYSGNIEIPARMLQLGGITVIFYCLSTVTNAILQGINKMTTPVKHGAISLVVHLIALFIMLVGCKWGIYSLIGGNIVFSFCMCILNSEALKRATHYKQEYRQTFWLPGKAALLMGVVTFAVNKLLILFLPKAFCTLIALGVAVIVYGVALLKLKALTPDDILTLPKGAKILKFLCKFHLITVDHEYEIN